MHSRSKLLIEWQPDYSVEIASIDKQHQYLVTTIRQLQEAMLDGRAGDFIARVFENLNNYTTYHFQFEEDLLRKHGYAGLDAHLAQHQRLVEQLRELEHKYTIGKLQAGSPVMQFLRHWLLDHIGQHDKAYASFLKEKGVS